MTSLSVSDTPPHSPVTLFVTKVVPESETLLHTTVNFATKDISSSSEGSILGGVVALILLSSGVLFGLFIFLNKHRKRDRLRQRLLTLRQFNSDPILRDLNVETPDMPEIESLTFCDFSRKTSFFKSDVIDDV